MPEPAEPRFSVVIAVLDEAENVGPVSLELLAALEPVGPFEVVFVDDGSRDSTASIIEGLAALHPELRLLRHDRRCGKTAALRTGIRAARAAWVITMDGDGQNDPADLTCMLEAGWQAEREADSAPLVAGIRRRRRDTLSKRIASKLANGLRRRLLGDDCPDTACGLKAFRRDHFLELPAFEGMHRFLPALFKLYGHGLVCCPVGDRTRLAGRSKYTNLGRALVGLTDLLGVFWLRRRTHLPARVAEHQR